MTTSAWDDILDDDETIVWQGRPVGGLNLKTTHLFPIIFGFFFAGFALFWMIAASRAGGYFWMFGLLHFGVGLAISGGMLINPIIAAKRTWYTLTNKRGMIARTSILGQKSLSSYPINADTQIEYVTKTFEKGSVFFANKQVRNRKRQNRTRNVPVGFENITDAANVQRLIRDIQKAAQ
jgi:hypothetical protein